MNLQAGNPNLMKKALRVNPQATLKSFTNTTGDKAHAKERTRYVPTRKDPGAVPSPQMNVWKQPTYVPENMAPVRRGADSHIQYKRRGM